ncbi:MAG: DUF3368 domain-containing protein [Caldilineaceae bacterium]
MHVPPVIVNNTPLVALWVLNRLDLFRDLYGVVWIPEAVAREFLAAETGTRHPALLQSPWIQVVRLSNPRFALTYVGLDRGEAEVLALAVEHNARLVVIDERKGRRYAQRLGLALTGTLGILLLAKQEGLIPTVAPLVKQLEEAGLHLSADLVQRVLNLAKEV